MNTKLGPILTKTKVINFMTKIGLRLGMLINTTPGKVCNLSLSQIFLDWISYCEIYKKGFYICL